MVPVPVLTRIYVVWLLRADVLCTAGKWWVTFILVASRAWVYGLSPVDWQAASWCLVKVWVGKVQSGVGRPVWGFVRPVYSSLGCDLFQKFHQQSKTPRDAGKYLCHFPAGLKTGSSSSRCFCWGVWYPRAFPDCLEFFCRLWCIIMKTSGKSVESKAWWMVVQILGKKICFYYQNWGIRSLHYSSVFRPAVYPCQQELLTVCDSSC